jgi:uncharacterized protein
MRNHSGEEPLNSFPKNTTQRIIDSLVDFRIPLVVLIVAISAVMAYLAPGLKIDATMQSGINTESPEYKSYREFLEVFGNEEFILVVIKNERPASDEVVLNALQTITSELEKSEKIVEVISLANLRLFREQKGVFGTYPVLRHDHGRLMLPDGEHLKRLKTALPITNLLLSADERTIGIIVRIDDQFRMDVPVVHRILSGMESVVRENLPAGSEYRIIGPPVIRGAIQKYNVQTALQFGILCTIICTIVSYYIFKSFRATVITVVVIGLCVLWILGFMSLFQIPINSTTALAFGLILISSVEPVIHLVTHFNESLRTAGDRITAAKKALTLGAGPCLVTSFTTSFGFSSLIVASLPMIRELGVVLSLGPLLAFVLSISLTPAFLIALKPLEPRVYDRMSNDLLARGFRRIESAVFAHHKLCVLAIFAIIVVMLFGAPLIRSDTQILRMLTDSTPELTDLKFVEKNLAPVNSLELIVEAEEKAFKSPEIWKRIKAIDERLKKIPEVAGTDSFLPLMEYLNSVISARDTESGDVFSKPGLISELLFMTSLSAEGKRLLGRYLDDKFSRVHISVRIRNSPSTTIRQTIDEIRSAAEQEMGGYGKSIVTGDLVVFEAQASEIVSSQTYSLLLAILYMTILLTIQFRSLALGLISLFPQILPQAVIFGLMGWFGISLDSVTVFAASVSIGLTVDNTVHYLTQLKREISARGRTQTIEQCLSAAYEVTARAMISNHAVIFFGFIMLLISPFRPVVCFGVLGSAAILCSLIGDLVFMPSIILSSSFIRKLLTKEMTGNNLLDLKSASLTGDTRTL